MSAVDVPGTDQQSQEPLWHVTKIEDTIPFGPGSSAPGGRVKRVWFQVLGQDESYVDVPLNQFTPENVWRMVNDYVQVHAAVRMLQAQ